jgi:predicted transposase/invertase (TIGR01784 family)
MQLIPIEEAVREIQIRDAKEEGQEEGKIEVARSMLADGLPAETIKKYTGLDENDILALI